MTIHVQRKGRRGELQAVEVLRQHGFLGARRGSQNYRSGAECPDIIGVAGLHLEIKRGSANLSAAVRQAVGDSGSSEVPTVLHRRDREAWLCTVRLTDVPRFAQQVVEALHEARINDPFASVPQDAQEQPFCASTAATHCEVSP